jgi:PAS domain S-box-containing protein
VEAGIKSAAAVPLLVGDRAVGVLLARTYRSTRFADDDLKLMRLLAAQAAPALEAARLHVDLASSERRFRATFEASSLGVAQMDLKGHHRECNPAFLAMVGHTAEELQTLTHEQLIHPEDLKAFRVLNRDLVSGKRDHYRIQQRYLRSDRSIFWGEVTVSLVRHPGGAPRFWFAMIEDVTARRRIDALRAAQLAVTRTLAEASTLKAAAPLLLQTIGENVGWEVGELWHVDGPSGVLRCVATWHSPEVGPTQLEATTLWTAFRRGEGLPGTIWETGLPMWITEVAKDQRFVRSPIAAQAGLQGAFGFPILSGNQVLGVLDFYTRDVAAPPDPDMLSMMGDVGNKIGQFIERRRAEDTSTRLGRMLDESPSEIFIVDQRSLRILQASQRARVNLGYSQAQLSQMTLADVAAGLSRDQFRELLEPLRSGQASHIVVELSHRRKDGSLYPVEARFQLSHAEVPAVLLVIVEDVSDRRRAEQVIRESQERTRLLDSVASELRRSLELLLAQTDALVRGEGGPTTGAQLEALQRMRADSQRMLDLTAKGFGTASTQRRMRAVRAPRRAEARTGSARPAGGEDPMSPRA